jgi:aminopeptidase N
MEISNFYTVTVYNKGAEVVRMIAHLLGAGGLSARAPTCISSATTARR